ncbi:MAG: carbon-nitrogen hydrolase family protein [Firmicutes bacterium]|nr:carbon-nitrogen hydrolase family protein [Bacillota bacterium]
MKDHVNVSCVQMEPRAADYEYNVAKMERFVEDIMEKRPDTDLIVFPELCTTGYVCTNAEFDEMTRTAAEDPSVRRLGALAKRYGAAIVYGFSERDPDDASILYNAAAILGKDGSLQGTYRKVHPFDTEKKWCTAGSEYPLFEADFGKFGVMICWDTAFPEVARTYALKGAELLVVCTNWEIAQTGDLPMDTAADWDLVTRARAFDNTLHLVSANRVGNDRGLGFFGHSNIVDPVGNVIEALNDPVEGVIFASLDLGITEIRRRDYYTNLADRRPDTYGELVKE